MNKKEFVIWGPKGLLPAAALLCFLAVGCSRARQPENEKSVTPVSGTVLVDGEATAGVEISFHPETVEKEHQIYPKATTDAEGKFKAWSYRIDDGLAAGNYTLTFIDHSGPTKPFQRVSDKPDLFKGKYADAATSTFKLTVPDGGEPIVMDTIELTRK